MSWDSGFKHVKVLGLCGQAGAGKDFTQSWLHETYSPQVQFPRLAFADGVREEATEMLNIESDILWQKPYPIYVRHLLQWWGTEFRRAEDKDYWVRYGMEAAFNLATTLEMLQIEKMGEHSWDSVLTFTDVRFKNEAEAIQAVGGKVLEVKAEDSTRLERLGGVAAPAHASEVMDFETDGYILNALDGEEPVIPDAGIRDWLGL